MPQGLANTAWAFATANRPDEKLFTALAREAERRVSDVYTQALDNTAWAFVAVNQVDGKLFAALHGERGGAAGERLQRAGAGQHGMGICKGEPVG